MSRVSGSAYRRSPAASSVGTTRSNVYITGSNTPGTVTPGTVTPGTVTPGRSSGTVTPGRSSGRATPTRKQSTQSMASSGIQADAGSYDIRTSDIELQIRDGTQSDGGQFNRSFADDSDDSGSGRDETDTAELLQQEDPDAREADGTKKEEKKPWDPFRENLKDTELYSCEGLIQKSKIVIKLVFILILLAVLVGCLVVSKLCIMLVVSNLHHEFIFTTPSSQTQCDVIQTGTNDTCGVPACKRSDDGNFGAKMTVRWIWCMVLCLAFPYLIIFIRSTRKILFKKKRSPKGRAIAVVLLTETLHTFGLVCLMFIVLPELDVIRGTLLMTGTAIIPSLLKPFSQKYPQKKNGSYCSIRNVVKISLHILAVLTQFSAAIFIPLFQHHTELPPMPINLTCPNVEYTTMPPLITPSDVTANTPSLPPELESVRTLSYQLWVTPLALILISLAYWENFVDEHHSLGGLGDYLVGLRQDIHQARTKITAYSSTWKMMLTFVLVLPAYYWFYGADTRVADLFTSANFYVSDCEEGFATDWLVVWGIQAGVSLVAFFAADVAVKAFVQEPTLSLATFLSTPVTLCFLFWACVECGNSPWQYDSLFYWNCFAGYENLEELLLEQWAWFGFIWMVSQWWISSYMWTPRIERLAKLDHIFMNPAYCGGILEQSLIYNRRRNDEECTKEEAKDVLPRYGSNNSIRGDQDPLLKKENDSVPKIFICGTMWHETTDEMVQILKSIFRLDDDHRRRRYVREFMNVKNDPNFYQFEAHIFFDDAYEQHRLNSTDFTANRFVKQLAKTILIAAFSYHGKQFDNLRRPLKYPTPYGGRMVYTLPGGNMLVVHMKDKMKIRHRKRWSQVMYMRYLLGQRLWAGIKKRKRKDQVANNTFLLALDGDVDFKPEAVLLLVDLMKRNGKVGAACGRIHPVGKGPMVWYQKFEYAISHWMMKATEHVLGCVLCSPGCFSLFRASALMDDNVVQTYSKGAEKASDHIQYNQGEDRWLCTLLLQQGHRVEYSAAADAMTYAPEGFNEFFNQRRRWTPSTMANIMDLLASGQETVSKNENISMLYMIYQGILFVTSIIGPGTIFLLIVGALEAALMPGNLMLAFILVLIPIIIFFVIAMTQKTTTQLMLAAILSAATAVLQMVVLVSLMITLNEYGLCNPAVWMMLFVLGVFLLAAILHPQEASSLVHLFLFFILIPAMYLIMLMYSLCNMHDVSWGTRETVQTTDEKKEEQAILAHADQSLKAKDSDKKEGFFDKFGAMAFGKSDDSHASSSCSCGPFCSLACCFNPGKSPQDEKLEAIIAQNGMLLQILEEKDNDTSRVTDDQRMNLQQPGIAPRTNNDQTDNVRAPEPLPDYDDIHEEHEDVRDDMMNPKWCEDADLGDGDVGEISNSEISFWEDLIQRYLFPLDLDKEKRERLEAQLLELRNKAVLAFFMINVIFVVLIQTLQVSDVNFAWNCTNPISGQVTETDIEPIGLSFVIVFGFVIFIQVVGMLMHRLFSLLQIVSSTPFFKEAHTKDIDPSSSDDMRNLTPSQALSLVKRLDEDTGFEESETKSMTTVVNNDRGATGNKWTDDNIDEPRSTEPVSKRLNRKQPIYTNDTIDKTFAKKFVALHKLTEDAESSGSIRNNGAAHSGRGSVSKKTGLVGSLRHKFRRPSHDGTLEEEFHKFRKNGVNDTRVRSIQERYGLGDSEIDQAKQLYQRRGSTTPVPVTNSDGHINHAFTSPVMASRTNIYASRSNLDAIDEEQNAV